MADVARRATHRRAWGWARARARPGRGSRVRTACAARPGRSARRWTLAFASRSQLSQRRAFRQQAQLEHHGRRSVAGGVLSTQTL